MATTADSWCSHLARTALDDHEAVLADGTGRLGEGVRGTGLGGLKGLVICLQAEARSSGNARAEGKLASQKRRHAKNAPLKTMHALPHCS